MFLTSPKKEEGLGRTWQNPHRSARVLQALMTVADKRECVGLKLKLGDYLDGVPLRISLRCFPQLQEGVKGKQR